MSRDKGIGNLAGALPELRGTGMELPAGNKGTYPEAVRALCLEQLKALGASSWLRLSGIIPEGWPGLAPIAPDQESPLPHILPISPDPPSARDPPVPQTFRFPQSPHFHSLSLPQPPRCPIFPPLPQAPCIPQPPHYLPNAPDPCPRFPATLYFPRCPYCASPPMSKSPFLTDPPLPQTPISSPLQ